MTPSPHFSEPSEAEIQHAAYHLWLHGGREAGQELDHWLKAKELLRHPIRVDCSQPKRLPANGRLRSPRTAASLKAN